MGKPVKLLLALLCIALLFLSPSLSASADAAVRTDLMSAPTIQCSAQASPGLDSAAFQGVSQSGDLQLFH